MDYMVSALNGNTGVLLKYSCSYTKGAILGLYRGGAPFFGTSTSFCVNP